jgi:peptide subunit release factor 1 (eRF1)
MSVRSDTERIRGLADRFESESAPGYAVFASSADKVFVVEALAHEVPDRVHLGHRPYLRPLRAAPRQLRAAVLVADRSSARTFAVAGGMPQELGEPIEVEPAKRDYGGFSGYDEPSARQRAAENSVRMWKDAGARLLAAHEARPFDYIVIGAQDELVDEISGTLHAYLARLPRVSFPAVPGVVTPVMLRAETAEFDSQIRRDRQSALAGRVCDTAWSGGLAVLGLSTTLKAVNAHAAETLVVAGDFARPGVACLQCGHLDRSGEECPVCGSGLVGVDDVVADAMEAVVSTGGRVNQIEVPSPLDLLGAGALTRFPVPG